MNIKNLISAAAALLTLCGGAMAQDDARYTDARELNIIGKAMPTPAPYQRVDLEKYSDIQAGPAKEFRRSAGIAVVFRTDSKYVKARWTTTAKGVGANMCGDAQKGLDLYIRRGGEWVFAGFGQPKRDVHEAVLVNNMAEGEKECLLYLPLFDETLSLEIGVEPGARLESMPNPFRHRIVVFGSSITHGAAAGRAGMSYVSLLGRRTGMEFINLGISGQSVLQPEIARMLCDVEAEAFVLDAFSNPSAQVIHERAQRFVEILREGHPDTPLIFLQTIVREGGNFDLGKRKFEDDKRAAAREEMARIVRMYDKVYFLEFEDLLGRDHNATVDGTHPTDLGFERMLEKLQPAIMKLLRKNGIKN